MQTKADEYDSKHGSPGPDHKPLSDSEAWGTDLNPVKEGAVPYKNAKKVG